MKTLAAAHLVESYSSRVQLEFNFRDAKQDWGLEDFQVTGEAAVGNAASLFLFWVLVSEVLSRAEAATGQACSISALKARYRGWRSVRGTIKSLRLEAQAIKTAAASAAVSRSGRIHQDASAIAGA